MCALNLQVHLLEDLVRCVLHTFGDSASGSHLVGSSVVILGVLCSVPVINVLQVCHAPVVKVCALLRA